MALLPLGVPPPRDRLDARRRRALPARTCGSARATRRGAPVTRSRSCCWRCSSSPIATRRRSSAASGSAGRDASSLVSYSGRSSRSSSRPRRPRTSRSSSSEPATQSRVDVPPTEVRLHVQRAGDDLAERGPGAGAGRHGRFQGAARTEDGGHVVVAPVSGLVDGRGYTVRWRVIGVGRPLARRRLHVRGRDRRASRRPTQSARPGRPGATISRAGRSSEPSRLLIGPLVVRLVVLRGAVPPPLERRFHLVGVVAAFLVIDIGITAFVLRASNALQVPIADLPYARSPAVRREDALRPRVPRDDAGVRGGRSAAPRRLGPRSPGAALARAGPLARPVSGLSLSGHQATEPNAAPLAELADWLHLVAASIWVGGVATLAFLVWPLAPSLRRAAFPRLRAARDRASWRCSSSQAPTSRSCGSRRSATSGTTEYGRFLLLKIAHRRPSPCPGARCITSSFVRVSRAATSRTLGPSLVGEATVAFAVLLAAAILTNLAPPPVDAGPTSTARRPPARRARTAGVGHVHDSCPPASREQPRARDGARPHRCLHGRRGRRRHLHGEPRASRRRGSHALRQLAIALALVAAWLARAAGDARAKLRIQACGGARRARERRAPGRARDLDLRRGDTTALATLRDVLGGWMLVIALVGIAVNLGAGACCTARVQRASTSRRPSATCSPTCSAPSASLAAAVVILTTGWLQADPIVSILIGLLVLASAWTILRDSTEILLESTPRGMDADALGRRLAGAPGVVEVHDLHVWTITSGFPALSAHVLVRPRRGLPRPPARARAAAPRRVRDRAHDAAGRPRRRGRPRRDRPLR